MQKRHIWCWVALCCLAAWAEESPSGTSSGCVPLAPVFKEGIHIYDDCWEVETLSPPTTVPLFEWEEVYEEPKINLDGGADPAWRTDCLAGSGSLLKHTFTAPPHTVTKGKIGWKTENSECIPDGGEEEEIDLKVSWKWQAPEGADPPEGSGKEATFTFGAKTPGCHDVVFTATGTPDREGCPEVTASVTSKISSVGVKLILPKEPIQTCCTPVTRPARVKVDSGCDEVTVTDVEWSARPEGWSPRPGGSLAFVRSAEYPDDQTKVDIKNIRWYPGEVEKPCDRTCKYQITANVKLSNGETCSDTKTLVVEAVYHQCSVRDNKSFVGDVDFWKSPLFNENCRSYVARGGTFRWKFEPSGPKCSEPELRRDCYFYDEIMAEELFHKDQYESFNHNLPLEIAIDEVFDQFNFGDNIICGSSESHRNILAMIEIFRIANSLFDEQMGYDPKAGHAGPLRCRLEKEAKNAANSTYFYIFECTYPLCK